MKCLKQTKYYQPTLITLRVKIMMIFVIKIIVHISDKVGIKMILSNNLKSFIDNYNIDRVFDEMI